MRLIGPAALGILAAAATSCAAAPDSERPLPAWFVERQAELDAEGYPDLANVPERVDAEVDDAHWDDVTRELDRVASEMAANPRSEPAPSPEQTDAAAADFDARARDDLERTRR